MMEPVELLFVPLEPAIPAPPATMPSAWLSELPELLLPVLPFLVAPPPEALA